MPDAEGRMTFKEIGLEDGFMGYFWFMVGVMIIILLSLVILYAFMWVSMAMLRIKIFPAFIISLGILGYIFYRIQIYFHGSRTK